MTNVVLPCLYNRQLSQALSPRPVRLLQIQEDKSYTGLYGQGDMCIAPADTHFFARWDSFDRYLQIRVKTNFIEKVAIETLEKNPNQLELIPEFRTRSPQVEAIGMMLLTELQQENSANGLYIDSLTNVLAVNLLRQHAATKPQLPIYDGGLPLHQLQQILDYIDAHLDRDIKLADLARLLDMSQFHFSHLFKQSIGMSPYQYLLQQRVERAKLLLKQKDRLIVDIALECGFSSHSHLSRKFRQFTGMTPKQYRTG
ncbi:MAG: AraC family transcriptional regulator [Rivularia sp. ALOHA_DT_140]|nr:AraC family transcriptional regulator [Rivularia sp. ALOHA_DT_140]